jgi:predicted dehydrogenase
MKILIVGLGSIGRRHLKHLVALGQKDIILLRSHKSTLPDDELAGYSVETDLQSALNHKPDAVIVSNPTSLHMEIAIPAVKAGCHIFLEKPISDTLRSIEALEKAIAVHKTKVVVGFQFRYHPALNKIKELLENQAIGRPISFRVHWGEYLPNWHPWEDYKNSYAARKELGGGVVLTLTHPLDYMRMLLGDVAELWSFIGNYGKLEIDVEDAAEIGLKFENNVFGTVHINYNQQPPKHQIEFVCTEGTIRWDNEENFVNTYDARTKQWVQHPNPSDFDRDWLFKKQMEHFIDVVNNDKSPKCTLEDGKQAVLLALKALDKVG